jgi:DNA-binding MarR family transcriptional regulator
MSAPRRTALIEQLTQRKGASVGQLLFRAARLYNERAMARVRTRVPAARQAHTALLPHIEFEGTRLTDIARRAGISKQAAGQLVAEMEAHGMLRREPDPDDGRAQRITFTEAGIEQLLAGIDVLDQLERELSRVVGHALMERLRRDLTTLMPFLEMLDRDSR